MSTWLNDVETAFENLNGIGALKDVYEAIKKIRTQSLPKSYEAVIRRTIESNSSDSEAFNGKSDIFYSVDGIGAGVWGLRSYLVETPVALDIDEPSLPIGNQSPDRSEAKTYRVLRDTNLARKIKNLYGHRCQVCGLTIKLGDSKY